MREAPVNDNMSYRRTIFAISWIALALLAAACSRNSSNANATGSFGGGRPPIQGSLVGNWIVQAIQVVADPGEPHSIRTGATMRVGNAGALVLAGIYVGPSPARRFFVERFTGGTYSEKRSITKGTFTYELIIDYSRVLALPPLSVYDRLAATGTLGTATLRVDFLFQAFVPRTNGLIVEFERDELVLRCVPGPRVEDVAGNWQIDEIEVLTDTGRNSSVSLGDELTIGNREVLSIFRTPFERQAFERANPGSRVLDRFSFAFDGVAQGYLVIQSPSMGRVVLFDFAESGPELLGWYFDLRVTPTKDEVDELLIDMRRGTFPSSNRGKASGIRLVRTPREIEEWRARLGR